MKGALVTVAAIAAFAISVSAAPAQTTAMTLTCKVGGETTVHNITDDKTHFRFRWWYADGTGYTAKVWAWYTNEISQGELSIRTHGDAVRAMAIEHRRDGHLVRVSGTCS